MGPTGGGKEESKAPAEKPKAVVDGSGVVREKYTIKMECSPEVLYGFMQRLAKDPWLFIVMDLNLENDLKDFPKRSEVAKKFAVDPKKESGSGAAEQEGVEAEGARGGANAPTQPPLLMVLAGKERLKVVLRVDYVGWRAPAPGKPVEKGKST